MRKKILNNFFLQSNYTITIPRTKHYPAPNSNTIGENRVNTRVVHIFGGVEVEMKF